ncbi:MAG TPA: winged helix-turn-helix domain-containing protein [Vicinamibacterales bacterium]|nr:winged helix-turn-helix domain-containing protein [Vicinamibacterales bacterium]
MQGDNPTQVAFGPFRLDRPNRRLHRGASVISLRPKTFAVLDYLVARSGRLVTKDQVLAAVWPETAVTDTVLKVCVREIRDALGDDAEAPRFVETAHRLGYRFIAQVLCTNLPVSVSRLIGRQRELHDIARALERSRLVTLVGAGGSGKSRLALEVASAGAPLFEDGVWWVDLAPVSDDQFVPQTVATALGVRDQPGQVLTTLVARFLTTREVLLVVDNCEHLIAAAARLVRTLLQAAPRLRVLATSREPLRTDGERIEPVPPLSAPDPGAALTAAHALEYDAIRLFDDRAKSAQPSFVLSDGNCQAVAEICRRLDGMPLAIELAAARTRSLSPEQISARLDDCFRVLSTPRRGELTRHETLRAVIDWSYDLLTEAERRLLGRLSVFVDSFTLEAVEHVSSGIETVGTDVVDLMDRLVDKSLVFVTERDDPGEWRYGLLETVRQYAYEKLLAEEDASGVLRRYCEYYMQRAEAIEPSVNTSDRQARLAVLQREHSNLRIAIERAFRAGEHGTGSRLASALFWFWFHRGHWREGRTFLAAAVHHETAPTVSRTRALLGDGVLAWAEGDLGGAGPRLEECVTIGRTLEDASTTAHALHFLAMVRLAEGRPAEGRRLAEDAVSVARKADDPFCVTIALASYGVVLLALAEYDEAGVVLEESVQRGRDMGDLWAVALPLRNLAIIACRRGEYDTARALLEQSLRDLRALGEKWFLSRSIETLAEVLAWQRDHERAAHLLGAAEALREAVGASVLAFYRADYDHAIATVRAGLDSYAFDRYWHEGRRMTPDAMVAYALGEAAAPDVTERHRPVR